MRVVGAHFQSLSEAARIELILTQTIVGKAFNLPSAHKSARPGGVSGKPSQAKACGYNGLRQGSA
jgi:hypothetical protein